MKKRDVDLVESLIRDEHNMVLGWMSGGCEGSLWDYLQSIRVARREWNEENDRKYQCEH